MSWGNDYEWVSQMYDDYVADLWEEICRQHDDEEYEESEETTTTNEK